MKIDSRAAASAPPNCHETRQARENEPSPFSLSPHPGVPPPRAAGSRSGAGEFPKCWQRLQVSLSPRLRGSAPRDASVESPARETAGGSELGGKRLQLGTKLTPAGDATSGTGSAGKGSPSISPASAALRWHCLSFTSAFFLSCGFFFWVMMRHPLAGPSTRSPPRRRGER